MACNFASKYGIKAERTSEVITSMKAQKQREEGKRERRREKVMSLVLMTNNAGSGVDERVYLLLIHATSKLHITIALSLILYFMIHCYTHTSRLLVTQLKHRNNNRLTKFHTSNIIYEAFSSQLHSCN
jgi:cellobiose-specific phosphotransferase system component IIA